MDLLIFLVIAAWALSAIASVAKKGKGQRLRRELSEAENIKPPQANTSSAKHDPGRQARIPDVREDEQAKQTRFSFVWGGEALSTDDPYALDVRPADKASASAQPPQTAAIPGLDLAFDADSLVKGVIYSEVLSRKNIRRSPHHESYSRGVRG